VANYWRVSLMIHLQPDWAQWGRSKQVEGRIPFNARPSTHISCELGRIGQADV